MSLNFAWLPLEPAADARLQALKAQSDPAAAWREADALARVQLDFAQVARLDRMVTRLARTAGMAPRLTTVRVALLASGTVQHLLPAMRIAALRRGLWLELYANVYGQYLQELLDSDSGLHRFGPQVCCILLDAHHAAALESEHPGAALDRMSECWQLCREHFAAQVIQGTVLPVLPRLLGSNEHRLPGSPAAALSAVNAALPSAADRAGVALFDAAGLSSTVGLNALHDPALWHLAKQEIHPAAAPVWADELVRVVTALRGRSAKCLVLDLDNTVWGGVVGDDGLDGIQLSQGNAGGEAFLAFQRYCIALKARGIALAVCSKNDEANARAPFREHPGMLLREDDIACFVANWTDKAANLRHIAATLNLGLDALVFADDNPAERALIRAELPEVHVPELPADPAGFVRCLAQAGYFEATCCTTDDRNRAAHYRANADRAALQTSATDLPTYLRSLDMRAVWQPFQPADLVRVVQLINKTNQFNLTTPRVSEEEVRRWMADPCRRTWQVRLTDRFGDNGIVALMVARVCGGTCELESLLMSCRVLGRQLEAELVNLLAASAKDAGCTVVQGRFAPTAKNSMVRDLLPRLGFAVSGEAADGSRNFELALAEFVPQPTAIRVVHG